MKTKWKYFIKKLRNKKDLSFNESKAAFEILMNGKASDDEILDFLTLLSTKGESFRRNCRRCLCFKK